MAAAPPFAGENLNQHQYYFLAKLSEQGRQFEDMAFYMRSLFGLKTLPHFSNEEINLLVTSHQNLIDPLRAAWQTSTVAERENNDENAFGFFPHLATEYKQYIELKILTVCNDFLNLLRAKLNTEECPDERRAYLWRLVADFNRYIVEINHADNRRDDVYRTVYAYTQARDCAKGLDVLNPTKLGIELNLSMFYYQDIDVVHVAFAMAKQAYEDAATELVNRCKNGSYPDNESTFMMKIIRDNILIWESEVGKNAIQWRPNLFDVSEPQRRLERVRSILDLIW